MAAKNVSINEAGTVSLYNLDNKVDVASVPKTYKFTGDGGAATGTVGVNTFPMSVTVTNPGAGQYRFVAASGTPWTANKTFVSIMAIDATATLAWKVSSLSDSQIDISFYDTITGGDTDPATYTICIETIP